MQPINFFTCYILYSKKMQWGFTKPLQYEISPSTALFVFVVSITSCFGGGFSLITCLHSPCLQTLRLYVQKGLCPITCIKTVFVLLELCLIVCMLLKSSRHSSTHESYKWSFVNLTYIVSSAILQAIHLYPQPLL